MAILCVALLTGNQPDGKIKGTPTLPTFVTRTHVAAEGRSRRPDVLKRVK